MRSKTILGSVVAAVGVLLVAAAAVLYWAVVPAKAKLPADTNTTRQYDGTAKLLVSPAALAAGDRARAVVTNVPVAASRTVKVLATSGDTAQVSDTRTLQTATGQPLGMNQATYAVDRKTLQATGNHPADWTVVSAQGLTVSFPIPTKQQSYTGWVNETQTTTQLTYVKQETVNGLNTYVFQASVPASPIKDQQVLSGLPPALPVSLLAPLSSLLPLTDEQKARLAQALPSLTQPIPLSYTYSATATYWVEPKTGTIVNVQREEIRKAGLSIAGNTLDVPVYDVQTGNTTGSVQQATSDASHDAKQLTTYGETLPLIFLVVGALAIIGGVLLIVLGRRSSGAHTSAPA